MNYVVPVLLIAVLVTGLIKRVNVYDSFVLGAKKSFDLSISIFPYLAAIFIMVNALHASGLDVFLVKVFAPPFKLLGIPSEVVQLVLLRPFSGSGSLAILTDVYNTYGVDSYVGRCASVIMGSSETVFYVASVYFAGTRIKRTGFAIPIALVCNLLGSVVACLLCKFM
ncbi:MAG: spore maturation protein [Clostridiales bacterium]|nr:spore maturation protein [Clostridiales bacterium]